MLRMLPWITKTGIHEFQAWMCQVGETQKKPLRHIWFDAYAGLLWSLLEVSTLPHSRSSWSRQAQSTDGWQLKSGRLSAASHAK